MVAWPSVDRCAHRFHRRAALRQRERERRRRLPERRRDRDVDQHARAIWESRRAIELGARTGRAALAESYAAAGRRAEARAVLDELVEEFTRSRRGAFGVALVWAALGETTRALDWLDRAYEEHDFNMVFLNAFPEFDRLRASAQFQQLARRVGIPS
jgi:hypothetical protein